LNILIDIGHPGHVHLFRNLYFELRQRKHSVLVSTKDDPAITDLMRLFDIPFILLGKKKDSILGKVSDQINFNKQIWQIAKKENIKIGIGTSVSLAHVSRFSKMKSILLDDDDDEVQPLFVKYVHPFCDYLISPDVLKGKRKRKDTIYYPGLHELAYLHPYRFKPDIRVLKEIGLQQDDVFFVLRFNVFKAHHDKGAQGLSLDQKLQLIALLKPHGKIFITTERDIEPELKKFQLNLSPEKIHSLLKYAKLFIGDSQTMTSEAVVLGTPAIRCNSFANSISYLNEEEKKYGLTYAFLPERFNELIQKTRELLSTPNLKAKWAIKSQNLLNDKIDSTKFYLWLIENINSIGKVNFDKGFFKGFY